MSLKSAMEKLAPNQQRFLLQKIAESIIRHYHQAKQSEQRALEKEKKAAQEQAELQNLKQELTTLFSQPSTH